MTQSTQFDAAADPAESPFVELLQRSGCARILDAFLANDGFWLTEAHLEDLADVDQSTVNRNITAFEEVGLVESRDSYPTEYRLDENHPAANPLLEAHLQLHRNVSEVSSQSQIEDAESPFYLLTRTEGLVRILDAFLTNDGFWLTEAHLEDLAGVNQSTVNRHLDTLEVTDLVQSQGSYPTEYQLNTDHPAADPLLESHLQLHRDLLDLADHQWEIQVPTAESARELVLAALETKDIAFEDAVTEEGAETLEQDLASDIPREYNLSVNQDEVTDDSSDDATLEDEPLSDELGYSDGPANTKLAAAEEIRAAAKSQPA